MILLYRFLLSKYDPVGIAEFAQRLKRYAILTHLTNGENFSPWSRCNSPYDGEGNVTEGLNGENLLRHGLIKGFSGSVVEEIDSPMLL